MVRITRYWQSLRVPRSFSRAVILMVFAVLTACGSAATQTPATGGKVSTAKKTATPIPSVPPETPKREAGGDPDRGAALFVELPCAGCHGVTAQGQYGPSLVGTSLSYEEFHKQVRTPRSRMLAFDEAAASDEDLRDLYAWLVSLPRPAPTVAPASPPEATAQARNRLFPEVDVAALITLIDKLDELNFRVSGEILAVENGVRFTNVRLRVVATDIELELVGIYDTVLARQSFPAEPGDQVTLYGVGTSPAMIEGDDGTSRQLPKMQILDVVKP